MKHFTFSLFIFIMSLTSVIGQEFVDFSLESPDNELLSLDELKGEKFTLIDFWATNCKPCLKAMPKLNKIYNQYKAEGLAVVGISCDGPRSIGSVNQISQSLGIDYQILLDIDCEVMSENNFLALPTLVILNDDNEIVYMHEGYVSGDEKQIEKEIISLLQ